MTSFKPPADDYEKRVRSCFAQQAVMEAIGARLRKVAPGYVEIEMDFNELLTQQHAYTHAGIITTIVDSACGFAAYSLMPPGSEVLTVEYKVNFMAPAAGTTFIANGRVVRSGRTLTVCAGEVIAVDGDERKTIAIMQATMMRLEGNEA